ncbi:MAG: MarR family transcriptional regulator [Bdellovibrionales bacterium]|nr:MarR family transcriptional regulator [Bdellovibrionales bacterium]
MKTFTFKYKPNAATDAFRRLKQAVKSRKPDLNPDVLFCDSYDSMTSLMTEARFAVIEAIKEHKPDSMYQLAKILERDQANVFRDVKALVEIGILELEAIKKDGRELQKPVLLYDKIIFEWEPAKASGM